MSEQVYKLFGYLVLFSNNKEESLNNNNNNNNNTFKQKNMLIENLIKKPPFLKGIEDLPLLVIPDSPNLNYLKKEEIHESIIKKHEQICIGGKYSSARVIDTIKEIQRKNPLINVFPGKNISFKGGFNNNNIEFYQKAKNIL